MAGTNEVKRGRPRSAAADELIIAAVVEVLIDAGYEGLTVEEVARRSGVAKTTIYRRWSSRPELVMAAMAAATSDIALDDTGSLRGDLLQLVTYFLRQLRSSRFGPLVRAMHLAVSEQPDLADAAATGYLADRRAQTDVIIDRALARGELAPGVDRELIFDLCVGSLFMRTQVTRQPVPAHHAERVVDAVLLGYPNVAW